MKPPRVWFDEMSLRSECICFEEHAVPLIEKVQEDARSDLLTRIAELEDHIRWERASDWMHSSYGRDEVANRMLDGVHARRGEDWTGAEVSNEPTPAAPPEAIADAGADRGPR